MRDDDASSVADILLSTLNAENREYADLLAGRTMPQWRAAFLEGVKRFSDIDPAGCWIAEMNGSQVGAAASIRRGSVWGLAMLYVRPGHQGKQIGARLLQQCLTYADGASLELIMSSNDARAWRTYLRAGFSLQPTTMAQGHVDPRFISPLSVRSGSSDDLDLVAEVDRSLRDGTRVEDTFFLLQHGAEMLILDRGRHRGFAIHRRGVALFDATRVMLGATTQEAGRDLLRAFLAVVDGRVLLYGCTDHQDWAVRVAVEAGLELTVGPPVFYRGTAKLPGAWLPSAFFF